MKKIAQVLFFATLLIACSGKKNIPQTREKATQTEEKGNLYQKWKLVEVSYYPEEGEIAEVMSVSYRDKNLFIEFSKDGRMNFNLDVNNCSATFKEGENQTLIFKATDFICTQICCDTVKLNYHKIKRYKFYKNQLILHTDTESFDLELAK